MKYAIKFFLSEDKEDWLYLTEGTLETLRPKLFNSRQEVDEIVESWKEFFGTPEIRVEIIAYEGHGNDKNRR